MRYSVSAASEMSKLDTPQSSSLMRWYALPEEQNRRYAVPEQQNPHQCSFCGKLFKRAVGLKLHMQRHSGTLPHKCSFCMKGFVAPTALVRHLMCHIPPKDDDVVEDVEQSLHRDEESGVSSDGSGVQFPCTICNAVLCGVDGLKRHQLRHAADSAVYCSHCRKPFAIQRDLERHQSVCLVTSYASGQSFRQHECSVCGRFFNRQCDLNAHSLVHSAPATC